MGTNETEICSNCGREILRSEKAYIVDEQIVCVECERTLKGRATGELGQMKSGEIQKCANCDRLIAHLDRAYTYRGNVVCQHCYLHLEGFESGVSYKDMALKSYRFGIWGLILFLVVIGILLAEVALALGLVARSGMKRSGNHDGESKATLGIVLGLIPVCLFFVASIVRLFDPPEGFSAGQMLFTTLLTWEIFGKIGAAIWVGFDAAELMRGLSKEQRIAGGARSPVIWVLGCCFTVWMIVLPLYLLNRRKYMELQYANLRTARMRNEA